MRLLFPHPVCSVSNRFRRAHRRGSLRGPCSHPPAQRPLAPLACASASPCVVRPRAVADTLRRPAGRSRPPFPTTPTAGLLQADGTRTRPSIYGRWGAGLAPPCNGASRRWPHPSSSPPNVDTGVDLSLHHGKQLDPEVNTGMFHPEENNSSRSLIKPKKCAILCVARNLFPYIWIEMRRVGARSM